MTIRQRATSTAAVILALLAGVFGWALTARAADNPCHTIEIVGYDHRILFGDRTYEPGAPTYAEAGPFIWFTWGGGDATDFEDTLTFDVSDPDVESITACADGSVEISTAATLPAVVDSGDTGGASTAPSPVSRVPECELRPATLELYCSLPNRVLVIS